MPEDASPTPVTGKLTPVPNYRLISTAAMWRFGGLRPWQLVYQVVVGFQRHALFDRSAQFAYYATLSLAPMLIVAVTLGVQLGSNDMIKTILAAAENMLPPEAFTLVRQEIDLLRSAEGPLSVISIFGIVFLAISGRQIFLAVGQGLDDAYDAPRRKFLMRNLVAVGVTYLLLFVAMTAVGVLTFGPRIAARFFPGDEGSFLNETVRWLVSALFLALGTSFVYAATPSAKLRWMPLSPGAVFFALSWLSLTKIFRVYVATFGTYSKTYGALAGVVLLLIFLYMTGALLLAGGQINSVIHRAAWKNRRPGRNDVERFKKLVARPQEKPTDEINSEDVPSESNNSGADATIGQTEPSPKQ
ncbi:YihY/virulence factor BrkB family protein [Stratiformator vulcanicus]|uniref:YihY/virulence factor BrkB family protein n=1 Tax=Stratiformator vulcanicus TaxID=2527980 RepID=A0A517R1N1_9PLAN|nr:YihY/virulence factor BrkB family protein [Stratiformator vulcanicus]QDT37797.1 hypothetical protein Pan189_21790 [Stratiformator vulcanicus]